MKKCIESFGNELIGCLNAVYNESKKMELAESTANNGVKKCTLLIKDAKSDNIRQMIYLDGLFESFVSNECCLSDVVSYLKFMIEQNENVYNVFSSKSFEDAKGSIVFRLINRDMNETFLNLVPYKEYMNLAVVFYMLSENEQGIKGMMAITNQMMERWDTDVDTLYGLALDNTPKKFGLELNAMTQVLEEMARLEDSKELRLLVEHMKKEREIMYVMTNTARCYGASTILYPNVLKQAAEMLEDDIVVILGSVHEVYLVRLSVLRKGHNMDFIISSVNREAVFEEDVLSNRAYVYRRVLGKLEYLSED